MKKKRNKKYKATNDIEYNNFKNKLQDKPLKHNEYEKQIKKWCKKNRY